jgi:hypothetical protein
MFGVKICAKIVSKNFVMIKTLCIFSEKRPLSEHASSHQVLSPCDFLSQKLKILRRGIHFLSVEDIPKKTATLPKVGFLSQNASAGVWKSVEQFFFNYLCLVLLFIFRN